MPGDMAATITELQDPKYGELSDAQAADLLNAATFSALRPGSMLRLRTIADLLSPAEATQIRIKMEQTRDGLLASQDAEQVVQGQMLADAHTWMMGTSDEDGIDVGRQAVRDVVAGFVPAILTQDEADAILAYGTEQVSRAQQLGWASGVTHLDVAVARRGGQ